MTRFSFVRHFSNRIYGGGELRHSARTERCGFRLWPRWPFAIKSAFLLGAEKVIAIDTIPERLALARQAGAQVLDYTSEELQQQIIDLTNGQGPDAVIEAVGMESHGAGGVIETLNQTLPPVNGHMP